MTSFEDREAQRIRRLLRGSSPRVDWNDPDQAVKAIFKIAALKILVWSVLAVIFIAVVHP